MAVSGVGANSAAGGASAGGKSIADNFDTFLSILTTQLKNQNPLDPLDTNQFTSQLVQFTSVEQQLKTNDFLKSLLASQQGSTATNAVTYIGKEVTATGVTSELVDGKATWGFNAASGASDATVTIKDMNGNVVYSEKGSLSKGAAQFIWDGVGTDGKAYPAGSYQISIVAKNLSGNYVAVSTETTGKVTSVDLSGDEPMLTIGSVKVKLSEVSSVRTPSTPAPTT